MKDTNTISIEGRVVSDPKIISKGDDAKTATVTRIASRTSSYKDDEGQWQDRSSFFDVLCRGKLADDTVDKVRKGDKVYVAGFLHIREYQDKDGNKRISPEIQADRLTVTYRAKGKDATSEEAPF